MVHVGVVMSEQIVSNFMEFLEDLVGDHGGCECRPLQHDLLQLSQSFGMVQKVVMLRAKNQVRVGSWGGGRAEDGEGLAMSSRFLSLRRSDAECFTNCSSSWIVGMVHGWLSL